MIDRRFKVVVPNLRELRSSQLQGRALERAFARAVREHRGSELNRLGALDGALTERSMLAGTMRNRPTPRDVPLSCSVIELATRWRAKFGQTLSGNVAYHIGRKILDEFINEITTTERQSKRANQDREEALTQLLSIVDPSVRIYVHSRLLTLLDERAMAERTVVRMRTGDLKLSRQDLKVVSAHLVRRIESQGFEFLGRSSVQAAAFDVIEAGYDHAFAS